MSSIPNPFGGPPLQRADLAPDEDISEHAVRQVLTALEEEVDGHGWDQLHMLWAISRDVIDLPEGTPFEGLALGFNMGIVQVIPAQVPEPAPYLEWLAAHPGVMRRALFAGWSDADLARIQALVLVTEAWAVLDQKDIEGYDPDKRNLHAHPARKECRQVTAIDRAEREYMLLRIRGGGAPRVQVQQHNEYVHGAVPDALLSLLRTFQRL